MTELSMRKIQDLAGQLKGKKVLLRVDFDVPVVDVQIQEPFRIHCQKEMIDWLIKEEAQVVMVSHISAVDSFADLMPQLHILLGQEVGFIKDISDVAAYLASYATPGLLDNIRQHEGEKNDDAALAKSLAQGFDLYVNNAFAVSHRKHASVHAIGQILPSYAGLLIQEEVRRLQQVIDAPSQGKVVIMGGAKASTKVPVIRHLLPQSEAVLVGGVIANDILKAQGKDVKASLVDEDAPTLLTDVNLNDPKLLIPADFVEDQQKNLDIGPQSIAHFQKVISHASLIVWNGPMGMFEDARFMGGTKAIAEAILVSGVQNVIGGGDTIAAVNQLGLLERFGFVSTGGGAMLAFLAGENLPGLEILK